VGNAVGTTGGMGIGGAGVTTGGSVTNAVGGGFNTANSGTTGGSTIREDQNSNIDTSVNRGSNSWVPQEFNPWSPSERRWGQQQGTNAQVARDEEKNAIGCFTREGQWQTDDRSACDADQQRHHDRIRQLIEEAGSEKRDDVINALRNVVPEQVIETTNIHTNGLTAEQEAAIAKEMHDRYLQEERRKQEQEALLASIEETRYRLSLIRESAQAKDLEWFFTSNIDWLDQAKSYALGPRTIEEIRTVAEQTTQVIQNAATLMAQLPAPQQIAPAPPTKNIFAKVDAILGIMPDVFAMLSNESINGEQTLVAYLEAQDARTSAGKACEADVHSCWQLRTVVDKVVTMAETLNVAIEEAGKPHVRAAIEELFASRKGQ